MTGNVRGWWRRTRADLADVSPWPEDFLDRLAAEQRAVRKRLARKERPHRRRLARKAPEPEVES